MQLEDALLYIINWIRTGSPSDDYATYGYDIYIPNVIRSYFKSEKKISLYNLNREAIELSPIFFDAAWELCRRGILRPGVRKYQEQATEQGSGGSGFSITPFGRQWIEEANQDTFVPTEPERFAQMLQPYKNRFGVGFYLRAQEAVRCYGAHAYYACCAMCGAAAESVLLATAIAKEGNEGRILKEYSTARGRSRLENLVVGTAKDVLKQPFLGLTSLIKYWRDIASHGTVANITDNEVYTSLAMLLRYAMFVDDHWSELIESP